MFLTSLYDKFLLVTVLLLYVFIVNIYFYIKTNIIVYQMLFMFSLVEPIFNWPAFFWTIASCITSFFYLYVLIFFVSSFYFKLKHKYIAFLLISLILSIDTLYIKFNLTFLLTLNNFNVTYQNALLNNFVNKYHPLLLYGSFVFLLTILILAYYFFNLKNPTLYNNKESLLIKKLTYGALYFITFALLFGSFWAKQEMSWGGWWNWDSSENLGLLIFIIIISVVHKYKIRKLTFYRFYHLLIYIFIITLVYFVIQMTFEDSSHNFDFGLQTLSHSYVIRFDVGFLIPCVFYQVITKIYNLLMNLTQFYLKSMFLISFSIIKFIWLRLIWIFIFYNILFCSLDFLFDVILTYREKPSEDFLSSWWKSFLLYTYAYVLNLFKNYNLTIVLFYYSYLPILISLLFFRLKFLIINRYTLIHLLISLLLLLNFFVNGFNVCEIYYFTKNFETKYLNRLYVTLSTPTYCLTQFFLKKNLTQITNLSCNFDIEGSLDFKNEFTNEYLIYFANNYFVYIIISYVCENFYTQVVLIDYLLFYLILLLGNLFIYYFMTIYTTL